MKTAIESTSLMDPQNEESAALLNNKNAVPIPASNDNHVLPLPRFNYGSNIAYGVGMLAFMAIPPFIPGITTRVIIIGFMCVIVSIYTAAAIMAAMRVRHPGRQRQRA